MIEKRLFLQLREVATATCSNSYLMSNGDILTNTQYKSLSFDEKLQIVLYYSYKTNNIIKI